MNRARIDASEVGAASESVSGDLREGFVVIEQVPIFRLRDPVLRDALFSEFAPNVDEGRGILVGERPEKNAIHDAEDGGIGAYPEGESEDRNNREARRPVGTFGIVRSWESPLRNRTACWPAASPRKR